LQLNCFLISYLGIAIKVKLQHNNQLGELLVG
jgi:hypothetical protein